MNICFTVGWMPMRLWRFLFWKGPTGFLTLRNAKKYKNQTGFLRMLNYAVISSLNEYFLLETRKLTIISPRITNATDVYISLFGELKITTEKCPDGAGTEIA